jgi:hypothetical protein
MLLWICLRRRKAPLKDLAGLNMLAKLQVRQQELTLAEAD